MKVFSRLLFLFLIQFKSTNSFLENRSKVKNECVIRLETEDGFRNCFNTECSIWKDPLRIIESFNETGRCLIHYLHLAFSSYDSFVLFIEQQTKSVGEFFSENLAEFSMFEVELDVLYPFTKHRFLSEKTLNDISGKKENINTLIIEIKRWYFSSRTKTQIIDYDILGKQTFEKIIIIFPCGSPESIKTLLLDKSAKYQMQSTCPSQLRIQFQPYHWFQFDNSTRSIGNQSASISDEYSRWNLSNKV